MPGLRSNRALAMPKRTDISTILVIGAGPIVIGQACEFDYSGTQAVKALKAEGYRIVLVNSNPATIMTDPELADATYIEPITPEIVAKIIEKERHAIPGGFALLPTMGGQTALNTALSLRRMGVLEKFDVEMIGANADAIDMAEDRELFREAMQRIGLATPKAAFVNTSELKKRFREERETRVAAIDGESSRRGVRTSRRSPLSRRSGRSASGMRRDEHRLTAQLQALACRQRHRPAGDHPPLLHARRHRAAASPTRSTSFTISCSAGSTPRPPTKC